jgi:hypothetical protein
MTTSASTAVRTTSWHLYWFNPRTGYVYEDVVLSHDQFKIFCGHPEHTFPFLDSCAVITRLSA